MQQQVTFYLILKETSPTKNPIFNNHQLHRLPTADCMNALNQCKVKDEYDF